MAFRPVIVTTRELADKLHVHTETIKRWSREGVIPAIVDERRTHYYNLRSVMHALRGEAIEPEEFAS